jgi:putative membrane protein insertion efficiency factor
MKTGRIVEVSGVTIELAVDETLASSVLRAFAGTTPLDAAIDALPVPTRPFWLSSAIGLIRWYRRQIASHLGQRCVFEPSCSRYAELALRKRGLVRGSWATIGRLRRCRPGHGGMDLPNDLSLEEDL